jgi:hypothetical protein
VPIVLCWLAGIRQNLIWCTNTHPELLAINAFAAVDHAIDGGSAQAEVQYQVRRDTVGGRWYRPEWAQPW